MAKKVYGVLPKKIYSATQSTVYGIDMADDGELVVDITSYYVSSWTQAIQDACAALKTIGGGTISFPAGDYLIKPLLINVSGNNIQFKGVGTARLYTTETVLWNYCIMVTGDNVIFNNLTFDHRGDSALLPTTDPYKGAISILFFGSDYSTVRNCNFYSYAIVTVLCNNYGGAVPLQFDYYSNNIYWQRKVDSLYDVSCVNLQARTLHYYNNNTYSIQTAFTTWKARTGAELHFAKGYVTSNTFDGSQVGILYLPWGAESNDYDASFGADVLLNLNTITKAIIGFEMWVGISGAGRDMRNVTIENNSIGLYLANNNYSKPCSGVLFYRGGSYAAEIYDVEINNNAVTMTWDTSVYTNWTLVKGAFYHLVTGADTGVFCLNIQNTMKRINIHDNTIANMPYSVLNLYRRNATGGTYVHEDITYDNNDAVNCSYQYPYQDLCNACFNLGYTDTVAITNCNMSNPDIAMTEQKEELAYLTNLTYTGNTFT